MSKVAYAAFALAVLASSQALADTHYLYCYGGGRAAVDYSANFAVPAGTKSADTPKLFNAFIQKTSGTTNFSECHSDRTMANSKSAKKLTENSDQKSKFPSKLIETGWSGK